MIGAWRVKDMKKDRVVTLKFKRRGLAHNKKAAKWLRECEKIIDKHVKEQMMDLIIYGCAKQK